MMLSIAGSLPQPVPPQAPVGILEDDAAVREGLDSLLRSVGISTMPFASAATCIDFALERPIACLVVDVRLPGLSGFDVQARLEEAGAAIPIVFISGYGDVGMAVKAMKAGAIDFLQKPFRDQDVLDAIGAAIERRGRAAAREQAVARVQAAYATLSPREREVMALVSAGLMNKQVAGELGLSEITVKIHRGRMMRKMRAASLPDLVRMADLLGLQRA